MSNQVHSFKFSIEIKTTKAMLLTHFYQFTFKNRLSICEKIIIPLDIPVNVKKMCTLTNKTIYFLAKFLY